jgi:hypothetical protein
MGPRYRTVLSNLVRQFAIDVLDASKRFLFRRTNHALPRDIHLQVERLTGIPVEHLTISRESLRVSENKQVTALQVSSTSKNTVPFVLVQITTNSRQEFRIYDHQAKSVDWHAVAPRVHSARRRSPLEAGHHYSLLTEHVRLGLPDTTDRTARRLAQKVLSVSFLPVDQLSWVTHYHQELGSAGLIEQFLDLAIAADQLLPEFSDFENNWERMLKNYSKLRVVPCHNDINYPNIGYRHFKGDQQDIVFLDWKQFNMNYLGCDMHHLVKRSIARPKFAPIFEAIYREYRHMASEAHQVAGEDIDKGTLTYALLRCMWRTVRTNGGVMQAREVGELYGRLSRIGFG